METDRKLIGSLLLASVAFLFIIAWTTTASAVNATASRPTGQTVLSTLRRGPTVAGFPRHAAYRVPHKAWPKKAARAATHALPTAAAPPPAVPYHNALPAACYSGCNPYNSTWEYSWTVPATAGGPQITYYPPIQPQLPASPPRPALQAGARTLPPPPPLAAYTPPWTYSYGCGPYPAAQSATWPQPAVANPGQTYDQYSSMPQPKRKLRVSARTGRVLPGNSRARRSLTGRTALAANEGASCPTTPTYGWDRPAAAGPVHRPAIPIRPTVPPAPPVIGAPAASSQTITGRPSWPLWWKGPYKKISSLFSLSWL